MLHTGNMSYDQRPTGRSYDRRTSSYELVFYMTVVFPSLNISAIKADTLHVIACLCILVPLDCVCSLIK
jgi:hypothetical protein